MKKGQHGFSLPEIMVVIVGLLLFAALTVPSLTTAFNAWQLNADARKISTTLMSAKLKTTSQATRYRVHFDVANNSFRAQKLNRTTGNYEDIADEPAITLSDGIRNSGIHLMADSGSGPTGFPTGSSEFIIFNSRGIPITNTDPAVPTGANVIYLSNGSTNYAVTVSVTGRIQLWKFDGTWLEE
jgi:prepilin-type N-terminal cleavage/methylation domain-containing protein